LLRDFEKLSELMKRAMVKKTVAILETKQNRSIGLLCTTAAVGNYRWPTQSPYEPFASDRTGQDETMELRRLLSAFLSIPIPACCVQHITKHNVQPRHNPVWRRVRILPPQSLRVVRGDKKGTQSQMRR
jgi:hypothetical protein